MRKSFLLLVAAFLLALAYSCDNSETYADKKKKERNAISEFIRDSSINVISEATFKEQGYTTNVSKNEYVLIESSGVYFQILRKGCGEPLKDGETATVLCRFSEFNILGDTLQLTNNVFAYSSWVDKMTVTRSSDSYEASFISGVMYSAYGSTVPSGWLSPLNYINIGRPEKADDDIAKVKLIVPHSQGQEYAASNVYPCFYVVSYEKGI